MQHNTDVVNATAPLDVVVIGGGFAGCSMSIALGRAGHKVMMIDINAHSPASLFRAEKISTDQLHLLRELDLLDDFKSAATPVDQFINIRGRRIIDCPYVEEYGLLYSEMIEVLRKRMPPDVFKLGRVMDIELSANIQRVTLANGDIISTRLVVLATGQGEALCRKLGLNRHSTHAQQTVCVGFFLKPPVSGFRFPALAAYGERYKDGVDYVSLFPLGDKMRGNLFMFCDVRDARITALRQQKLPALLDLMPGLQPWIEDCEWVGETAIFPVELDKCDNIIRNGIIAIGDAFRTSCPAVGTGLSCALVDVIAALGHIDEWLKTEGMDAAKISSFYSNPTKAANDAHAYRRAARRRYVHSGSWVAYLLLVARFYKRFVYNKLRLIWHTLNRFFGTDLMTPEEGVENIFGKIS